MPKLNQKHEAQIAKQRERAAEAKRVQTEESFIQSAFEYGVRSEWYSHKNADLCLYVIGMMFGTYGEWWYGMDDIGRRKVVARLHNKRNERF